MISEIRFDVDLDMAAFCLTELKRIARVWLDCENSLSNKTIDTIASQTKFALEEMWMSKKGSISWELSEYAETALEKFPSISAIEVRHGYGDNMSGIVVYRDWP